MSFIIASVQLIVLLLIVGCERRSTSGLRKSFLIFQLILFTALQIIPSWLYFDDIRVQTINALFLLGVYAGYLAFSNTRRESLGENPPFNSNDVSVAKSILLCALLILIFFVGIDFVLPPLFGENPELERMAFMSAYTPYLRITNYMLPLVATYGLLALALNRDVSCLWKGTMGACLYALIIVMGSYGGNKTSIFAHLLVLFYFIAERRVPINFRLAKYVGFTAICSVVVMVVIYVQEDIGAFVANRLYESNLAGLRTVMNYTDQQGHLYGMATLTPILLFLTKTTGYNYESSWSTPGQLMAMYDSGTNESSGFEYLNGMQGDAYLDFGFLGVIIYAFIVTGLMLSARRAMLRVLNPTTYVLYFFLYICAAQCLFIGKIGSFIVSSLVSYLVIGSILIYMGQSKSLPMLKITNP